MVDHVHVFWYCPVIQSFWKEVGATISKTLGFVLNSTFISLYSAYIPDELDADNSYLLRILLAANKETITKKLASGKLPYC